MKKLLVLAFLIAGCPTPASLDSTPPAPSRLVITNGTAGPMWIFWQSGAGGGTMDAPHQISLAGGGSYNFPIPDRGIAGTRFWPGYGCDDTGNNCTIGQSGDRKSVV